MATYDGHVIPGQDTRDWINPDLNEGKQEGKYSNYSMHTTIQPLSDMPTEGSHVPGTGREPHGLYLSEIMRGISHHAPLDYQRYVHGGQDAPYLWDRLRTTYRGVPSGEVFPTRSLDWGHAHPRETSTAHFSPYPHRGVPSSITLFGGHQAREYSYSTGGPTHPLDYDAKGVSGTPLEDPGLSLQDKPEGLDHAFQRTREWHGVPSARAL